MDWKEIATLNFSDVVQECTGTFIIRRFPNVIGICLSLANDGDVEGHLSPEDTRRLIDALSESLEDLKGSDDD